MESSVFNLTTLDLAGTEEMVLRGGRHLIPLLPTAFAGVRTIGIIGWGAQGRAQALNLRDSLRDTAIEVVVGLRPASPSRPDARSHGFTERDGTLGDIEVVLRRADLAIFLISDAALADHHRELFQLVRPCGTVGLSHGFLLAHLEASGELLADHVSVIAMCPKGMGASVRRLYEQGSSTDGAGINASIAVHRDLDGRSTDRALAWAVAVGAPYVFETTLESEYLSDITGERAVLLSVPHAIAEAVFRRRRELGDPDAVAFERAAESLTGPLARTISRGGIASVVDSFGGDDRRRFEETYCAAHPAMAAIIAEAYDEVASGAEIRSVRRRVAALDRQPMEKIDGTRMWRVGAEVRAGRDDRPASTIDPETAGIFIAALIAQVDVLRAHGHRWSEIANESVIEVVDSLLPYMHARGIAYMVDSCSMTARVGARKWEPRFEAAISQQVFPSLDDGGRRDEALLDALLSHPLHDVLAAISEYRPSVDVSVAVG